MALSGHLNQLEATGLLQPISWDPELEYLFRHALIQEAAYESLLRRDRRRLHLIVGESLEQLYAEQRNELASLLGYHFHAAGDAGRALHYLSLAADTALDRHALPEATTLYSTALKCSRDIAISQAKLLHLYSQYGRAMELGGRYQEALEAYRELEELGRQRAEPALELAAVMARAGLRATPTAAFDAERAPQLLEQALALATRLNDDAARCKILWTLMQLEKFTGQPERALAYGEQALAIARSRNLREQLAFILNDIIAAYHDMADQSKIEACSLEAEQLWRELDRLPMLADCLASRAYLQSIGGQYDQALKNAEEARRISERIGNLWGQSYSRMPLGHIYTERGEITQALEGHATCIALAEQAGFVVPLIENRAMLALLHGWLGDVQFARQLMETASAVAARQMPMLQVTPISIQAYLCLLDGELEQAAARSEEAAQLHGKPYWAYGSLFLPLVQAELASARADLAGALVVLDQAIGSPNYSERRPYGLELQLAKARVLLAQGAPDQARALLEHGRAVAEETGGRRSLWQILALLAEIADQQGQARQAAALRRQAAAVVHAIADSIPSDELRRSFLASTTVRALLASTARRTTQAEKSRLKP